MDPLITSTIVWGVLWFFAISIGTWIGVIALGAVFVGLAALFDEEWIAGLGVVLVPIAAGAWAIFSIIQVVIHVVTLIQLLTT